MYPLDSSPAKLHQDKTGKKRQATKQREPNDNVFELLYTTKDANVVLLDPTVPKEPEMDTENGGWESPFSNIK
ncbi:hypothetical protein IFM47457_10228 [Aspergillus lentulus]|nr:hypothetical protein IFM47457_10228 [Aspergillus lentulus]